MALFNESNSIIQNMLDLGAFISEIKGRKEPTEQGSVNKAMHMHTTHETGLMFHWVLESFVTVASCLRLLRRRLHFFVCSSLIA